MQCLTFSGPMLNKNWCFCVFFKASLSSFSIFSSFLLKQKLKSRFYIETEASDMYRNNVQKCLDFRLRRFKTDLHLSTNHSTAEPNPDTHYSSSLR